MNLVEHHPFTLHVRLTKACNADCSYCSSWQENPDKRMSPQQFREALISMYDTWQRLGIQVTHLTIEYVGGEILLIPTEELRDVVQFARSFFQDRGIHVHDGVQTNLLGSERRINNLRSLFGTRIGTSIDDYTGQRTLNGSADGYQTFFRQSEARFEEPLPAVFTLDPLSVPHALDLLERAEVEGRPLTLRPAFTGGREVTHLPAHELESVLCAVFDRWVMRSPIAVEPLATLLSRRLSDHGYQIDDDPEGFCPHQSNCTRRSMSLEPNGDLYVCQEMGDAGLGRLGNALTGLWDPETWSELDARPRRLTPECYQCDYYRSCQGGCMLQSHQHGHGFHGRTDYCSVWKALFSCIDLAIERETPAKVGAWLSELLARERALMPYGPAHLGEAL